jgi:cobalt-zinc-cadmium efflux system membrane fusion protein
MRSRNAGALCAALLMAALLVARSEAHEGHDHGEQQAAAVTDVSPRSEASSALFEMVAFAKGEELLLYVDRFVTNEPVENAIVEVETPAGPMKATAETGRPYRLAAPFLAKPGRYELIVSVSAGNGADVLPLTLSVAEAAKSEIPSVPSVRFIPAFKLPFVGPDRQALLIGGAGFAAGLVLGAMLLRRRRRAPELALFVLCVLSPALAFAHEGHDHAEDKPAIAAQSTDERAQRLSDGSIFVPKPVQRIFGVRTTLSESVRHPRSVELPGRIIPDPNGSGYVQSAVGGRLSAPEGGFPRLGAQVKQGDVLTYVTPPMQAIDVSDMRQKQGELDQQIAIVERRLARQEQLAASATISRSQLEETRLDLQGLRDRRASLDKVRREPEPLIAPVSGVVAEGTPVAGQIVASSAIVFHIVDPGRLWVEALSFNALARAKTASASTAEGRNFALLYRGSGLAGRSQSIPVHFAISGDTAGLRAGQFVTVVVATDEEANGIALPRGSLVRAANGQDLVFEHIAAERFIARAVRTEPLDAERVLIAAGLSPGKRIVTQGAELLDHVR